MTWGMTAVAGATLVSGYMGSQAAKSVADTQAAAARDATQVQKDIFNTQNAQQAAGRGAGYQGFNTIRSMLPGQYTTYDEQGNVTGTAQGSDYLTHQFNAQDFANNIDPGYAFRLQQGEMANQRASNVGGGALSGNTLAGLQAYTQGEASQEYGNAFNRYQTQRSNIYNTLASIAGLGQTSQQQANQAAQSYGANTANLMTGAAAAQAAGTVGSANAWGNAIQSGGNMAYLNSLRNNPNSQTFNQNTGWSGGGSGQVYVPGEGTMSPQAYFSTTPA